MNNLIIEFNKISTKLFRNICSETTVVQQYTEVELGNLISFDKCNDYLHVGENVTFDPIILWKNLLEMINLNEEIRITIDPKAKIITPYDVFINQNYTDLLEMSYNTSGFITTLSRKLLDVDIYALDLQNPEILVRKLNTLNDIFGNQITDEDGNKYHLDLKEFFTVVSKINDFEFISIGKPSIDQDLSYVMPDLRFTKGIAPYPKKCMDLQLPINEEFNTVYLCFDMNQDINLSELKYLLDFYQFDKLITETFTIVIENHTSNDEDLIDMLELCLPKHIDFNLHFID